MINTTAESLNTRIVLIFQRYKFYEQLKFHSHLILA